MRVDRARLIGRRRAGEIGGTLPPNRKSRVCRSARHGYPMLVVMTQRLGQRQDACYPACATPWLTLMSDSEKDARGRSTMKMQPWSGRSRA
jgi:hypothetical protein